MHAEQEIRRARRRDLETVASWLRSAGDCRLWAGWRVAFPVDAATLPEAIEWDACESWVVTSAARVVAFGQVVPKPAGRVHLARLIVAPERRGEGIGGLLAAHLLAVALARGPSCVSLNVLRENAPARTLYASLGFVEVPRPADEPASDSAYMERPVRPV